MKTALNFLNFALISPRHLQSFLARIEGLDLHRPLNLRNSLEAEGRRRQSQTDDKDDEDEDQNAPWWTLYNAWGDKLARPQKIGATAVIPVEGVITSGLPTIYRAFGYADTVQIADWVKAAVADDTVEKILLRIDSPGGMVTGTPELGEVVDAATASKKVVAHTAGMMDSAAYWIGSQADEVWCTPSADVGCIGVYQMYYNFTGFLEQFGVTAEMFKSGDLKGTGHPDVPLSKDQAADIQKTVDLIGVQFRAAVTNKRVMVEPDSMRGQSFIGAEAAERHLVAGLRTFESLLE